MARSKIKIVQDILKTIKENKSCKKTKIVRFANINWKMANRYIKTLEEEGFVETEMEGSRDKEPYFLTEKGENLLKAVKNMREISSIF